MDGKPPKKDKDEVVAKIGELAPKFTLEDQWGTTHTLDEYEGKIVVQPSGRSPLQRETKISYNRRQFYDRILTPMKSLGLIDYDMYSKKYKLSDRFNKVMIKVGLMWLRELDRLRNIKQ